MTFYWIFYLVILITGAGLLIFNYLEGHRQAWEIPVWLKVVMLFVPILQGVIWGMEFATGCWSQKR